MKLLAIETSTEWCSVALSLDGEVRARARHAPRRHAELLLPWVSELLAKSSARLQDLDALAFSRGPGSFTSLRIGIGAVQGLAWGAGIPVVPISSLQATAQGVAEQGVDRVLVALDARMDEVFCGAFRRDAVGLMQAVGDEAVCAPEQASKQLATGWSGVGNGFTRYDALKDATVDLEEVFAEAWPQATAMLPLAEAWLQHHEPLPAEQAQPVYLRDRVAEKPGPSTGP